MNWLGWRSPAILSVVIVNLRDEPAALRGVLVSGRGPWLVLRNAEVLAPNGPQRMDGDVFIPRANVTFVQAPPPE